MFTKQIRGSILHVTGPRFGTQTTAFRWRETSSRGKAVAFCSQQASMSFVFQKGNAKHQNLFRARGGVESSSIFFILGPVQRRDITSSSVHQPLPLVFPECRPGKPANQRTESTQCESRSAASDEGIQPALMRQVHQMLGEEATYLCLFLERFAKSATA